MKIFSRIKEWFITRFSSRVKEEFDVESVSSSKMDVFIDSCVNIYKGEPYWLDAEDGIGTICFAKAVCGEVARLSTLALSIKLTGSERTEWLQQQIDKVYFQIRNWVEYGAAAGTVILKPNGVGVDLYTPDRFIITDTINGAVRGAVFYDQQYDSERDRYYTRLERHRFRDDGLYEITNRCFVGYSPGDDSRPIDISLTPWSMLTSESYIKNLDRPLFGVLRMPGANSIDFNSPLGMPIFSDALQELHDLDVAYSRNAREIEDSKRTILLDSDKLLPFGGYTAPIADVHGAERSRKAMGLPDMVKNVSGNGVDSFYQEINPTLNTDTRLTGMNALINQIGYKCGFSNGYFVFNEKTGLTTATEVEADQQRTIQFIKDVRDKLEDAIKGLVYALNAFADIYNLSPIGKYDETDMIKFGSITYSFEAERQHYYGLAVQGKYPWEEYYVRFLKCTREEAQQLLAMVAHEQGYDAQLFANEE